MRINVPQFKRRRLIYGVGVNDYPASTKVDGVEIKEYRVWKDMLKRCHSEKYKSKEPSYIGTSCDPDWLHFSKFLKDVKDVPFAFESGYHLDKDVLGDGKYYSKETVCFIPSELNTLLSSFTRRNKNKPLCVRKWSENSYSAIVSIKKKQVTLGCYKTPEEAFRVVKEHKEVYIKEMAEKWKDKIDDKVYQSLLQWKIEIDD